MAQAFPPFFSLASRDEKNVVEDWENIENHPVCAIVATIVMLNPEHGNVASDLGCLRNKVTWMVGYLINREANY